MVKSENYEDDYRHNTLDEILDQVRKDSTKDEEYYMDPGVYSSLNVEVPDVKTEGDSSDYSIEHANLCTIPLRQLPKKSERKYEKTYRDFMDWLKESSFKEVTEDALLVYFTEKADVYKPTSLWALYSMLKTTMIFEDNIDIGKFRRVVAMLKLKNKGFVANRSRIFTTEQLQKFLREAPDKIYLMMKVAIMIGVSGGCRRDELAQMTVDDVADLGSALLFKISDPKSNLQRSFTVIPEQIDELNCLEIYRKYINLRPSKVSHRRLFVSYRGGKCTCQVVGVHTFGKIPSHVARYLQLPDPESYNGHSFRRSSDSLKKTDRFF